jgi:fluoroquinolone transport system permease protein
VSHRVRVEAAVPVTRTLAWAPLAGGALVALALLAVLRVRDAGPNTMVGALRLGAVLVAAGAAFALDDPAASTLASSPTPLRTRRSLRLLPGVAVCAGVWASLLALAGEEVTPFAGALTVEAIGMLGLTWAAAAVATGSAGGPALLFVLLAAGMVDAVSPQWKTHLLVPPGDPAWATAHWRWLALAITGALVIAWTTRDPAGGRHRALDAGGPKAHHQPRQESELR